MRKTAALCFDGVEDEELVEAATDALRDCERIEAWCAYGHAAEDLIGAIAARHHGPPRPPGHANFDEEQATAIAQRGAAILKVAGFAATPRTLPGLDAGHAIAEESSPEILIVLASGHRRERGPKSIGHVARFVIDHARGPVLVERLR
jgi:nucleotide-binding universal stress UspA family protein